MATEISESLQANIPIIESQLSMPKNMDAKRRSFTIFGVDCCLFFIDGMAGQHEIDSFILFPCREARGEFECEKTERLIYLRDHVLTAADVQEENIIENIVPNIISGKTVVLVDGAPSALVIETRNYEKRAVGKTISESVVAGSQQGFVENLRTNITLMRRTIRSPKLITEFLTVGTAIPTNLAIMYIDGACNENVLNEVRQRIQSVDAIVVPDAGHLQQLIEDRPHTLLAHMLQTERPDRTAYHLEEGRVAVLVDNSPAALIAPVSLFDFLQTADDAFMRWQYAMFNRIVRMIGLFCSLLLPGIYVAMTLYHTQMIPVELLSSIAETRSKVPFPILIELMIMEFAFYLINEAGTRMPSQIGPALGIVGALILGQAAVTANIISPIPIIIAAITGLGNYAIPDYGVCLATQIMRLGLLFLGALLGLYGITIGLFIYLCMLAGSRSFGQPFMAPIAPWRPHNPNIVIRTPEWMHEMLPFFVPEGSWYKAKMDEKQRKNGKGGDAQ